jgi:putative hemolysin
LSVSLRNEPPSRDLIPSLGPQGKRARPEISLPKSFAGRVAPIAQPALHRLLRWPELKALYDCVSSSENDGLIWDRILHSLNVTYTIPPEEVVQIPRSGPLVVVANHPYGGIEGIILAALLHSVRPDLKLMVNPVLCCFPELRGFLIPIDPFGKDASARCNFGGLRAAIEWVRSGAALVVFPAGEVAHVHMHQMAVTDPAWHKTVAAIIRRTAATTIPVYFDGSNGPLFQFLGMVHPLLRTVMLPSELLNKRNRVFRVRVGHPLSPAKLSAFPDDEAMTAYLRWRTYLLGQRNTKIQLPAQGGTSGTAPPAPTRREIPPEHDRMQWEIQHLATHQVLLESGDNTVVLAKADQVPQVMHEIGRLREVAFRSVGEGTGREIDLDEFDSYYHHLFVWNKSRREIVGAYRLALTDEVLKSYGKQGLYTSTLFHFQDGFFDRIGPALELGRSFVRMECQGAINALPLLWRGIGRFVLDHPRHKILFGPVSISRDYHPLSQQMMVSYLQQRHLTEELSRFVQPKAPFKTPWVHLPNPVAACFQVKNVSDVKELSELVSEIEADRKTIPVLLKHYLKLGGTVLGFNVDRNFSHVLDSLVIVDLTRTERRILERFVAPEGARRFLEFHQRHPLPAERGQSLAAA